MEANNRVKVWDVFVRFFHWSLVIAYVGLFITGENEIMTPHSYLGYFVFIMLTLRIIWGFAGSEYARFNSFTYSIRETASYAWSLVRGKPKHYTGHNPLGALMVFSLISLLLLQCITGTIAFGGSGEGPLAFLAPDTINATFSPYEAEHWTDTVGSVHGILFNLSLVLIGLHILGSIISSLLHRENLIMAMIHGRKKRH